MYSIFMDNKEKIKDNENAQLDLEMYCLMKEIFLKLLMKKV